MTSLLFDLNHAPLWQWEVCVWDRIVRATSLDRLLFLGLHRLGWMGKHEARLLRRLIEPGMNIIDIGANIGLYSLLLSKLTGENGRVYAFEPEPTLFRTLLHNCVANNARNIVPFQYAAADRNGRAPFARSVFNSGNNALAAPEASAVEVNIAKADDILPEGTVDFVKIDVQGYELAVLAGLKRTLTSNHHIRVMFEFWPAGLRRAKTEPGALLGFFAELGFTIYSTDDSTLPKLEDSLSLIRRLGPKKYTNLLAFRTGVPPL